MAETISAQYQHFVPQFLLKNFSHPYEPQDDSSETPKRSKCKNEKEKYPRSAVVHNLNLSADPPVLCETLVKRILGQKDMCWDTSKPSPKQQQYIERMFSKIECQASNIFRKITEAFEQRESGLWITRDERNLIRKFLFLLKYRGMGFYQRYCHESAEGYNSDDRELLHEYMADKGYKRPLDVWFDNLKTIMELHMDLEGEWIKDLPNRMFSQDAMWFIMHTEWMYMAICTPSNSGDEFVLTDNSYNVFEGPIRFAADKEAGKILKTSYTSLHEFAPISPKLMIVLRSLVLSVPEEDAYTTMKSFRDTLRSVALDMVYEGEVVSLLAELPIEKARNNYSKVIQGRVHTINGEEWQRTKKDHKFYFKFFPVETEHVHTINGILLDNAYACSNVVFGSTESFSRTLEWYLTAPCTIGKVITGIDADLRLKCLKNLAKVSQSLGSAKTPVWRVEPVPEIQSYEEFRLWEVERRRSLKKIIKNNRGCVPETDFMQIYKTLDGSKPSLLKDMEQASLMWNLRVKIDVWSQGLDESLRQRNRELLLDAYLRLPPRRVWVYMKYVRIAILGEATRLEDKSMLPDLLDRYIEGPEDSVAKGKSCHIVKPEKLAQLMYKAVMTDIKMKEQPTLNIWANSNSNHVGFEQFMAWKLLSLIEPCSISDCGIDEIEQLSQKQQLEILKNGLHNQELGHPIFEYSEKIEFLVKAMVRSNLWKC